MYRAFNLTLNQDPFSEEYYKAGAYLYAEQTATIRTVLDTFLTVDGKLDASAMQENWFPQAQADIFISHSHADSTLAKGLAGWLKQRFNLIAFVDSCAWGHAADLLRLLDNEYCYRAPTNTYHYARRNQSTTHVHAILSVALAQMIDNSECLFFLNTPETITPRKVTTGTAATTTSPWIYSEIAFTRVIRPRRRSDHRPTNTKIAKAQLD